MIEFISQLPIEYQEVEYIQSSGTQYIDTGVVATSGFEIDIKINIDTITGSWAPILSAHELSAPYKRNFIAYGSSGKMEIDAGDKITQTSVTLTGDDVIKASNIENNFYLNINGTDYTPTVTTAASNLAYSGRTMHLLHSNGYDIGYTSGKVYYCKITVDGTLVRSFVPCYRKSDNIVGLYDLVNGVFYTNAGTGNFAKGKISNSHIDAVITPGGVIPMQYALRRRMMASMGSLFPPIGTPLSDWTWEQIVALSNSGRDLRNYFSVGDEKDLILTTGEVVPVVIGDFYHNTITGTSTKAPIAFTFKNCLNTKYSMNGSRTNSGGWDGSAMRNTNMPAILNTFPAELIADGAIKYVDVLASAGSKSTSLVTSSDRLRLHSIAELGLSYSYAVSGEGTKYAYYTSGNRVKTVGGTASIYWTRSPSTYLSLYFCDVSASGSPSNFFANAAYGAACGFDI